MGDADETAKLWKVNRTIHELVKDRGFMVADDEINMDLQHFRDLYANQSGVVDRNQLNFYTTSASNPTDQIFVFFCDEKSVGVKSMRKLLSILEEKSIQRGIIVFPGNMTPSARKVIVAMASEYRLEEFSEADLLVNIVHHTLVPRHEVLTQEEKRMLLEKYYLVFRSQTQWLGTMASVVAKSSKSQDPVKRAEDMRVIAFASSGRRYPSLAEESVDALNHYQQLA
ncbi:hypothetical protein D9619_004383 [Psilocybe cf. subviscida]|uniref:DNA-directed RNA polymerases I, II, and III subunit RPABC1 n=1 Tax=Psilocybe cf. subviscida TaxID=2480587 RepID=A0A8H5BSN3_9AGAR|nr:hypothetical protein D9619_004383 [Psilocybe cf. subviscida]